MSRMTTSTTMRTQPKGLVIIPAAPCTIPLINAPPIKRASIQSRTTPSATRRTRNVGRPIRIILVTVANADVPRVRRPARRCIFPDSCRTVPCSPWSRNSMSALCVPIFLRFVDLPSSRTRRLLPFCNLLKFSARCEHPAIAPAKLGATSNTVRAPL